MKMLFKLNQHASRTCQFITGASLEPIRHFSQHLRWLIISHRQLATFNIRGQSGVMSNGGNNSIIFSGGQKIVNFRDVHTLIIHIPKVHFNKSAFPYSSFQKSKNSKPVSADSEPKLPVEKMVQVFDANDLFIGKMSKRNAREMAKRDNLKLVLLKTEDKNVIASYKLMTGSQLFKEEMKQKGEKKEKKDKIFKIKHNITDHDLLVKVKKMKEGIEKTHNLQVVITPANKRIAQEEVKAYMSKIMKKIQEELIDVAIINAAKDETDGLTLRIKPRKQDPGNDI